MHVQLVSYGPVPSKAKVRADGIYLKLSSPDTCARAQMYTVWFVCQENLETFAASASVPRKVSVAFPPSSGSRVTQVLLKVP